MLSAARWQAGRRTTKISQRSEEILYPGQPHKAVSFRMVEPDIHRSFTGLAMGNVVKLYSAAMISKSANGISPDARFHTAWPLIGSEDPDAGLFRLKCYKPRRFALGAKAPSGASRVCPPSVRWL